MLVIVVSVMVTGFTTISVAVVYLFILVIIGAVIYFSDNVIKIQVVKWRNAPRH